MEIMTFNSRELNQTERIAHLTVDLILGGTVTTMEVARRFGIGHSGAWRMLNRLSTPLTLVQEGGEWWSVSERVRR